jgi:hypothetical protein
MHLGQIGETPRPDQRDGSVVGARLAVAAAGGGSVLNIV